MLRSEQQRRLAFAEPVWLTPDRGVAGRSDALIVANEFLDALPIRQFVRGHRHWSERMVALDRDDRLVFADGPENPALSLLVPETLRDTAAAGTVVRDLPGGARARRRPRRPFQARSGRALFIDYGYFPSRAGADLARPVATTARLTHCHRREAPI